MKIMTEQKFSINYQLKSSTNMQTRKQRNTMRKRRNIRSRDQRIAITTIETIETPGVITEAKGETTEATETIRSMIDTNKKRNKKKLRKRSFRLKCLQKQIKGSDLHLKIHISEMKSQEGNQLLTTEQSVI